MQNNENKEVGAVWAKKDKNGNDYWLVAFGDTKYKVSFNYNKKEEKHPTWRITELPPSTTNAPSRREEDAPF